MTGLRSLLSIGKSIINATMSGAECKGAAGVLDVGVFWPWESSHARFLQSDFQKMIFWHVPETSYTLFCFLSLLQHSSQIQQIKNSMYVKISMNQCAFLLFYRWKN